MQEKAAKEVVENGRRKGEAMRMAGYSKAIQIAPTKVTKSKGWKEIMANYFPDDYMAKKHRQLFEKQETMARNNVKTGKIEIIKTGEIDANAVKSALDMGYKLKGKYAAEDQTVLVETLEQRLKRLKKENEES